MLAEIKTMIEEMQIWEVIDAALMQADKRKAQKSAHITIYKSMESQTIRRTILRSYQTLRKKLNNRRRLILAIL